MSISDLDQDNVILVTEANLKDEQKQAIAQAMEEFKQQCLKSFSINRSGEVVQKDALPAPRQVTFDANPGKLQDMVDNAINRALINQAGVLSNTVFNAVARTFKEGQIPPDYVGPSHHQPMAPEVTAPSAALRLQVHNLPSLQVHRGLLVHYLCRWQPTNKFQLGSIN